jgi:hypothetical protein
MTTLLATLREQEILDFAPQRNTNTRYTADNSLMSAMTFGTTVAANHFLMGPDPIPLSGENGSRTNAAKILQGCYLHFHREKGIWIRSGKTTGK